MAKIRILIVDDSVVIRRLLTDALSQDPDVQVAGTASIIPVARDHGFNSVSDLISEMQKRRRLDLEADITEALTTNETYFYRDVHPFDALKNEVIPELMKARAAERRLNIWCGASSTGQEPYSIAMLLYVEFPQLLTWKVDFTATDYSEDALQRAREGAYNQLEINRGLPAQKLTKHFTQEGVVWRIKDRIRKRSSTNISTCSKPGPARPSSTWFSCATSSSISMCPQNRESSQESASACSLMAFSFWELRNPP